MRYIMKNVIAVVLVLAVNLTLLAQTQVPEKMSYQAVIRNGSGQLVSNQVIGIQISVLQGSTTGTTVYVETQTPSTNVNGLVSIEIGAGNVISGNFSSIDWANGPYFIKTETDLVGGTNYTISGTSELLSVPYALHAITAESIIGGLNEVDPVFVASPANSISSADINSWNNKLSTEIDGSVTNELQTLSISNDTIYLSNGGFAKIPAGFDGNYNSLINTPTSVSSFSNDAGYLTTFTELDGSVTNELQALSISNDTIYLSNGGFAKLPSGFDGNYNSLTNTPTSVSSFSNDAGYLTTFTEIDGSITNELQMLSISNDTIFLSNGGFAKLPVNNDWSTTGNLGTNPVNNFLGTKDANDLVIKTDNSEKMRITSSGKVGIGTSTPTFKLEVSDDALLNGVRVGTGSGGDFRNAVLGYQSLHTNTTGYFNTAIGYQSMYPNTTGLYNTAVGTASLGGNTIGAQNCAFGYASLVTRTSGIDNAAFGTNALRFGTSGDENSAFGSSALLNNSGSKNTAIGFQAGNNNYNGTGNIFVGYQAGYNETGSNKLYIANSNANPPLIYGDFATGKLGLGTIAPTFKLEVTDDASFNGVRVGKGNGNVSTNTAIGLNALLSNTTGSWNTALGEQAMSSNTTGYNNSALGRHTLMNMITGINNTGVGSSALWQMNGGNHNTSVGAGSMLVNTNGSQNTAVGTSALYNNISGNNNTVLGFESGFSNNGSNNVFIGYQAGYNETGSNKLYIANSSANPPLIYGDFTNGNVGIGTTTIGERLVVQGNHTDGRIATFQNAYDEKYITMGQVLTDNGGYLKYKKSSNYTGIGVHGHSEQLIVNGAGNVGVGSTSPTAKFQVENYGFSNKTIFGINSMLIQSQTPSSRTLLALAPNGTQNADFAIFHNSDYTTNTECLWLGYENTLNNFIIGTSKNGTGSARRLVMDATGSGSSSWQQLVLATNGNVGIGTITPSKKLDVVGDINFTGSLYKSGVAIVIDGSETKINAGANIAISGNGTTTTPYSISIKKPNFYLGQDTLGGIVFHVYIGNDGQQHGFIVSKTETSAQWQSSSSTTNAIRSWDGVFNTSLMVNSPAKDWIVGNFSVDWYLPSIDELNYLWLNKYHVNKTLFAGGNTTLTTTWHYWSSTEDQFSLGAAASYNFGNGTMLGNDSKSTARFVRAIRSF